MKKILRPLVGTALLSLGLVACGTQPEMSTSAAQQLHTLEASTNLWINEVHYDNASSDVGEGVEIAGEAGVDLSGYSLSLIHI